MNQPAGASPPTPRARLLALIASFTLLAAIIGLVRPWNDQAEPLGIATEPATAGDPDGGTPTGTQLGLVAPDFVLTTTTGDQVRLSDLRGRPVFLNFWATWCTFCIAEMPAMQELAEQHDQQLTVIGVNVGESRQDAASFARATGVTYPLLLDTDRSVTATYRIRSMPTTYLIDATGVVANVRFGPMSAEEMVAFVEPVLVP